MRPGKLSVIGNGVVLDPWALLAEIEKLRGQGVAITPETLMIAENTPLILPLHQDLDRLREEAAGAAKIGTTGRGIGPAYEDKVGRRTVRVADLGDEATLDTRLDRLFAHHDALRRGLGAAPIDRAALQAQLLEVAPQILPYAAPVWRVLDEKRREGGASCSRARRGRCSTSTSAPIRTSPRRTPSPGWPRPAPAWGRARSTSCSASSRPTPPGSARGRSRRS